MKKYLLVVVCALLLVVVTGCGNKNQIVCSQEMTESGLTMKGEIIASLDGDNKVSDLSLSVDLGNKELANSYCEFYKQSADGAKVSCSGTKVTVDGLASLDDDDDEDDKTIGLTKEDFIKKAEQEGYTCK